MTDFNLDTALLATTDKTEVAKQKREVKKTFNALKKGDQATASACQMLFNNFAHCFDAEIHDKSFKLAKKKWFAALGYKNAEEFKNDTGLSSVASYFSYLTWGAKQGDRAFYDFAELRTAYANRPKVKPVKNKPAKAGTGSGSADADAGTDATNVIANMHPDLLEVMNRVASTRSYDRQADAALVFKKALDLIDTQSKEDLKIAA